MGKPLIRRAITAGLQTVKDGCRISGRTDTQQSEMIDGQIQQLHVSQARTLVTVWCFAYSSSAGPYSC